MPDPATYRRLTHGPATTASLRQRNRAQVLTEIMLAGQTTRAELVERTGLSGASITNLVSGLLSEGLVTEMGSRASRGGRPVAVLGLDPTGAYSIGADVGEQGVAVELFDLTMRMIDRELVEADSTEPVSRIIDDIDQAVRALRDRHLDIWPKVTGLGLGLPGPVELDDDGAQVLYAQSMQWPPVPVGELASMNLPVFADNGAKSQARAEMWFGAARGAEHAVVALLGRGVGMGVVVDGQLYRGAHSLAGEWGHLTIRPGGRQCRCGNHGCIEAYAGADAILEAWRSAGARPRGTGWEAITALLDAADSGDADAEAIVDDVIEVTSAGLGGLVNLLNPDRIVLGGWVGMLFMDRHAVRIRERLAAHALSRSNGQVEIVAGAFRGDAVALGAAIAALEPLFEGVGSESGARAGTAPKPRSAQVRALNEPTAR